MSFEIEKSIPLPPKGSGSRIVETLRSMDIGDSIVVPKNIHSNIFLYAARAGIKVTSRKIDAEDMRVWRVS